MRKASWSQLCEARFFQEISTGFRALEPPNVPRCCFFPSKYALASPTLSNGIYLKDFIVYMHIYIYVLIQKTENIHNHIISLAPLFFMD